MYVTREGLKQEVTEATASVYVREGWMLHDEDAPAKAPNVAELKAMLAERGIDVPAGSVKSDLEALLADA